MENLEAWFEKVDQLLADEELVLDGLRMAVRLGTYTEEEAEEYMRAYHNQRIANE